MDYVRITSLTNPLFGECWAIYNDSFPKEERRDLSQQRVALTNENYTFVAIVDEGRTLGVVGYWLFGGDLLFVEHIAIGSLCRGGGIGSVVIEYVKSKGFDIVLEIDPIVDDITRRRRGFYERLGFVMNDIQHFQPPFRTDDEWLPLLVMSYPSTISADRYKLFRTSQIAVVDVG